MPTDCLYAVAFFVTAAATVASALMVVIHRNPVINALYLVLCFFGVAVLYVLLESHFLAALQVLLYAGAVLVLFLMIVMLIRLDQEQILKVKPKPGKALAVAVALGVVLVMIGAAHSLTSPSVQRGASLLQREQPGQLAAFLLDLGERPLGIGVAPQKGPLSESDKIRLSRQALAALARPEAMAKADWPEPFRAMAPAKIEALRKALLSALGGQWTLAQLSAPAEFKELKRADILAFIRTAIKARLNQLEEFGTTASVGRNLFSRYLLPFEAASILLLAAIVGVLFLARRSPEEGGPR
ncbi:MAG: NADH-quinone oxidoreductase subunit J [Deltaproteobacteria bacterium]